MVLRGGEKVLPRASMLQEGASVSSNSMGVMRTILPSFTSTNTGPPVVPLVSRSTWPMVMNPFPLAPYAFSRKSWPRLRLAARVTSRVRGL